MKRPSWDNYFMKQCELISSRATCDRKHVGTVIVKDKRILATGYNGSLPNVEHCDDAGCDMENNHCVRTVHSEANAIADAARRGIQIEGATLYCNTFPCWTCFKLIVSSGIKEIVYDDVYLSETNKRVFDIANKMDSLVIRKFNAK